ncbi:hypothetical protein B0H19DRAFT_1189747 [Mycena capillaripes]|nr:hypothetical protein B0H19DRAFT_1189747 [Mycena capillaripes]
MVLPSARCREPFFGTGRLGFPVLSRRLSEKITWNWMPLRSVGGGWVETCDGR